ncbi:hypothetical protein Cadr_000000976 [Camelus dromedarius]|uniref:Uncharacterized protein n=1 Tax=Camelus dromedarius TaxID=9838 RepID=A0A5N4EI30_CAMDR|nr:hypothetical protein Cadr_000000976 [Camelus dromedarius]
MYGKPVDSTDEVSARRPCGWRINIKRWIRSYILKSIIEDADEPGVYILKTLVYNPGGVHQNGIVKESISKP